MLHAAGVCAQELSRANDALDRPALLVPSGQELQDLEHATQAASELTQQMLTQKMELEEKRRAAAMLQKALVGTPWVRSLVRLHVFDSCLTEPAEGADCETR